MIMMIIITMIMMVITDNHNGNYAITIKLVITMIIFKTSISFTNNNSTTPQMPQNTFTYIITA